MDDEAFRTYLEGRQFAPGVVDHHLAIATRFCDYLHSTRPGALDRAPTRDDVTAFTALLIREDLNTYDNLVALARYGWVSGARPVYLGFLELVDGSEAMANLYTKLAQVVGEETRDQIFEGIPLPALGSPNSEKPAVTQAVMERFERLIDPELGRPFLSDGLRDLPEEAYLSARETYDECDNLDTFLDREEQAFLARLEQIKDQNGLFFNQEITDEVLAFVRAHREISRGVRVGRILYEVKIPYLTREYLTETDERMKRYYYCHCPWVRESLRAGDVTVSPTFCLCSAGFHKRRWEVILNRPLRADIVESVLKGDPWCKIAIYLPEDLALDG